MFPNGITTQLSAVGGVRTEYAIALVPEPVATHVPNLVLVSIYQGESVSFRFQSTPYIQYPLRLDHTLHERFTRIASSTKIPKSTLGRIGITRLLNEIDEKGITQVLNEIES